MNKEYKYRKHIYWGQYAIGIFFALLFVVLLGLTVFLALQAGTAFFAIIPGVLAPVFLVEGILLWYFYYRLAGTSVVIDDDVLIYTSRKGVKRYPLESLYLEFSSIKYTGGWLKIKTGQDTLRLTVVLEDISGFLQELKTKLDDKGLSSHYDPHQLFGFLKTAAAADQSWERAYALLGKMFLLILDLAIAIFTGYMFGTAGSFGLALAALWASFSMLWVWTAYAVAEIILMRQIALKSNQSTFSFPQRDLAYEKLVFDKTFLWGGLTYFLFSSLVLGLAISIRILLAPI